MTPENKFELLKKFLENRITDSELELLYRLINSPKGESELVDSLSQFTGQTEELTVGEIDTEKMLNQIRMNIRKVEYRKRRLLWVFGWASVVMAAIGLFWLLKPDTSAEPVTQTILRAENVNVERLYLPDSSVVWLFPESQLVFDNHFGKEHRKVRIEGQAFLDVRKNYQIPFVVACNQLNVEVTGTRFDVEAFPGQDWVRVVLESGKVELTHQTQANFKYALEPGDLAEYRAENQELTLKQVNAGLYCSWRDGKLVFKEEPLWLVFEKLERHFGVDIEYNISDISTSLFTATITSESVFEVLRLIGLTTRVQFSYQREGDTIVSKITVLKPDIRG